MIKKLVLILTLSILILSISGCTDEAVESAPENNLTEEGDGTVVKTISDSDSSQDLVPTAGLPGSYEFLGSRGLSIEKIEGEYANVPGIVAGYEGLYMYMDSTDLYIDVIEMESPSSAEELIVQYREGFRQLPNGDRFTEDSINGHSVLRIVEYSTINMDDVERYTYIWNNDRFVFVVGGATEDYYVLRTLAESTGY